MVVCIKSNILFMIFQCMIYFSYADAHADRGSIIKKLKDKVQELNDLYYLKLCI